MRTPQFVEIQTIDPSAVFSVGEAAKLLGVSHNGLLGRIKAGTIRAGRSGHRYFIPGAEIQKQIKLPGELTPQETTAAAADNL